MPLPATDPAVSDSSAQESLAGLRAALAPQRERLLQHPLYEGVDSLPRLRRFMGAHVFAVWDFMSLVKRLQRDLTCTEIPWVPPACPALARFVNGIVLAEESDVDADGQAASHLDLYVAAMEEIGARTGPVRRFLALLRDGVPVPLALSATAPPAAQAFVLQTLDTVQHGTTLEVLAAFLFGREDLIPDMFTRLLPRWQASRFGYYVRRHVELDGGEHGPAGERALQQVAGTDPAAWQAATRAALAAIGARSALWDRVHASLEADALG